ncbi:Bacteriohemerythrin [uncultured Gammaproteobacteria bacterium]
MALLEWRDEFKTGVPGLDYEHKDLIAQINHLHESLIARRDRTAIGGFFSNIYSGISAHFALEEKFMRDHGYEGFDAHKADHERLLDEILDLMAEAESNRQLDFDEDLSDRLQAWFAVHFRTMDGRLHEVLGEVPSGEPWPKSSGSSL